MGEILKQLLEWIKTPVKYFLPILLISAFGLFAPELLLIKIGIIKWRNNYNIHLGSIFIISFFFVSCHYSIAIFKWVSDRIVTYSAKRKRIARIKSLTFKEQEILAEYFKTESKTVRLLYPSGVITGLEAAEIIYASSTQVFDHKLEFNIQEWAWSYININMCVLGSFVDEILKNKEIKKRIINFKKQRE